MLAYKQTTTKNEKKKKREYYSHPNQKKRKNCKEATVKNVSHENQSVSNCYVLI